MVRLGVNIDHVATVRQARRTYEPDPLQAASEAEKGGADGITVHLREDRRHIQDEDVRRLREQVGVNLNFEMAATDEMVEIASTIRPETAMLVPEGREEITTEGGLDVLGDRRRLKEVLHRLNGEGITTSVFIDADPDQIDAAAESGAQICEVHTGPYAAAFYAGGSDPHDLTSVRELQRVAEAGRRIRSLGMGFNAGHALNYQNVQAIASLEGVYELHIGHSIVSRAVFAGLQNAVREMKSLITRV